MPSLNASNEDRVLTMSEVRSALRFKGQGGLYRLIKEDPDFVTFKVNDLPNAPRLMRESALQTWIKRREAKERAA